MYHRTIAFALTFAAPNIANLLNGTEFQLVTADSLLDIRCVIDPPPAAAVSATLTIQRNTGGNTLTPVNGSALKVPIDGIVGSGPTMDDRPLLTNYRVSPTDTLIANLVATGLAAGQQVTGRLEIELA